MIWKAQKLSTNVCHCCVVIGKGRYTCKKRDIWLRREIQFLTNVSNHYLSGAPQTPVFDTRPFIVGTKHMARPRHALLLQKCLKPHRHLPKNARLRNQTINQTLPEQLRARGYSCLGHILSSTLFLKEVLPLANVLVYDKRIRTPNALLYSLSN